MKEFWGWIPTITGRLSFSTVGTGKNPKKEFKYFRAIGPKRLTVVAQKRRITDAVLGHFGDRLNKFRNREGYSVFVFFGEANQGTNFDILSGPCVEVGLKQFEKLKPKLEELKSCRDATDASRHFVKVAHDFLEEAAKRPGAFSAVKIHRNGKTDISFTEDSRLHPTVCKILASQVFFFLRDITHVHQHHAPTTDTILDVTSANEGEAGWKRETLYSLYRWVIHRKRERTLPSLLNCCGVLAYAEAFEKTHCAKESENSPKFYKSGRRMPDAPKTHVPTYNHDTTLASVMSSIEALKEEEKTSIDVISFFTVRVLPLFALFIALFTPLYDGDLAAKGTYQQRIVASVAIWANENILITVPGMLLLAIFLGITTFLKRRYHRSNFLHDLIRVLLAIFESKTTAVGTLLFLIFTLIALALNLFGIFDEQTISDWFGPARV